MRMGASNTTVWGGPISFAKGSSEWFAARRGTESRSCAPNESLCIATALCWSLASWMSKGSP